MTTTSRPAPARTLYHQDAYHFLFAALRHAQRNLNRIGLEEADEERAHISGQELLEGVRDLAIRQFGLLAKHVFKHWGVEETADFGRMVFEMIDRGEMKRTDNDRFSDFVNVYDFEDVFDRNYQIDTTRAFIY